MPGSPLARAFVRSACAALCALAVGAPLLPAQAAPPAASTPASTPQEPQQQQQQQMPPAPLDPRTEEALQNLARRLQETRAGRDAARASGDAERATALDDEVRRLGFQFAGLTTRIDVQEFEAPQEQKFDLQRELEQLIRPVVQKLKEGTEDLRVLDDLESRIAQLDRQRAIAEAALRATERVRDQLPADSAARAEAQRELTERWRPTIEALRGELLVLQDRLRQKRSAQQSLFDRVSRSVGGFVESSGLTLLLAAVVFVLVYVGLRWLVGRALSRRRAERPFYLRVLEVLSQALILLIAVAAMLVVPYARDDWFLLAIGIIFLLGAGWVLVRTLPQFLEQIRIVLNLGAVREGERIVVDGLPYRIESLKFYSKLRNPDLEGGELRIPVRDLIGQRSRRSAPDEPWFPCRSGDVVLLGDGQFGTVRTQTPEVVVVEHYGTWRSYRTTGFLEQTPRNLSRGFAVRATVGVDYGHQAEAVTVIPERLRAALERALAAEVGDGELKRVLVDLAAAGSSSLDLRLIAEFAGTAAHRYLRLERRLQAVFVATCTEHGWRIPFPQLTVHRADAAG